MCERVLADITVLSSYLLLIFISLCWKGLQIMSEKKGQGEGDRKEEEEGKEKDVSSKLSPGKGEDGGRTLLAH